MVRLNNTHEYEFYYGASAETKAKAKELRGRITSSEKLLWNKLRNRQIKGLKFRRQHPVDIFILDFYCHEIKLAIEVDGGIHLSSQQKEWDDNRSYELKELGINVIRFANEQVMNDVDLVVEDIYMVINKLK